MLQELVSVTSKSQNFSAEFCTLSIVVCLIVRILVREQKSFEPTLALVTGMLPGLFPFR